ncbi:M1 family metallopeptidase [Candidatus Saccharibacteria bacterium]|nr:M1 family metallopeptidase [Candidatus Saccharibacteria bacterium]
MEQLLTYFKPKNYQLDLKIDKEKKTLKGKVVVRGTAKESTVKFHAVGLTIEKVKLSSAAVDFVHENDEITIKNVPVEDVVITINYHSKLNENMQGAYLSTYTYKNQIEKIVSTQFESHYAREAFPCIDEPAAKATYDLAITLPEGSDDLVLANTPVAKKDGDTTIFETTPRMSTYLLAFVIGKFNSKTIKNNHGTVITTYASLNQSPDSVDYANEVAARSLEYYENQFCVPYPLEKLDQVAIPDFEAGAMENWGLVTYRESMLLADKTATLDTKKSVALTVAHELSHQWFGDLVTMKWWDDLWLNESFASIMEYYAVDKIYPEYNIWEEFFTGDCMAALSRDAYQGVQSVFQDVESPAEIATLFDGAIVYAKGARLMLMLIRLMGEEKFLSGIRDYFKQYRYSNTVGDNLWDALAKYADFDVKKFMHTWISQPGYPVLTGDTQKRFLLGGAEDDTTWPLPKITDDMSGHYLINLSDKEFADKLKGFADLNLEQCLRLLIDRMLLAKTDLVKTDSLLDLLVQFKDETSPSVWEIIARIVAQLKLFFVPESEEETKFKKYILELITPQLKRLGTKPAENSDDLKLQKIIFGLDFYANDTKTLQKLAGAYADDLTTIPSEIRSDVLDAKLCTDEKIFDTFLKKYQKVADPELKAELLYAMTLTRDEKNIETLISLLEKPDVVKPQNHVFLFLYTRRNYKASERALTWLTTHWDYIQKMAGEKMLDDYLRYTASTVKTREESDTFFNFFNQFAEHPVLKRALTIAKTEIKARIDLIEADREGVYKKLK